MASINASVGAGGRNHLADVRVLQEAFNSLPMVHGRPSSPLRVDGTCGRQTLEAIARFQLQHFGWTDRLVEVGGMTIRLLNVILGNSGPGHFHSPEAGQARAQHRADLRRRRNQWQAAPGAGPAASALTGVQLDDSRVGRAIAESVQGCVGRVAHASGTVVVIHAGSRSAVAGGRSLYAQDIVETGGDGRAQVFFADGCCVAMPPETRILMGGPPGQARRAGQEARLETGALGSRLPELRGTTGLPAL